MPDLIQITETLPLLHDTNCVYCHVDLELNDLVAVCDECRSPHHQECWEGNDYHCATFGCSGSGVEDPLSNSAPSYEDTPEPPHIDPGGSQSSRPIPRFDRPSVASSVASSSSSLLAKLAKSRVGWVIFILPTVMIGSLVFLRGRVAYILFMVAYFSLMILLLIMRVEKDLQ